METDSFWTLITECRQQGPSGDKRADWLRATLAGRPAAQIVRFQACLEHVGAQGSTWNMWAAADRIFGGWCSDDTFCAFLMWLIGLGRPVYEAAVADPDVLAYAPEVRRLSGRPYPAWCEDAPRWESLGGVARSAYAEAAEVGAAYAEAAERGAAEAVGAPAAAGGAVPGDGRAGRRASTEGLDAAPGPGRTRRGAGVGGPDHAAEGPVGCAAEDRRPDPDRAAEGQAGCPDRATKHPAANTRSQGAAGGHGPDPAADARAVGLATDGRGIGRRVGPAMDARVLALAAGDDRDGRFFAGVQELLAAEALAAPPVAAGPRGRRWSALDEAECARRLPRLSTMFPLPHHG